MIDGTKFAWRAWMPMTILFLAAVAYIVKRSLLQTADELDFRFIWTAGHMWSAGTDPYAPDFARTSRSLFPTGNLAPIWVYPPNWWLFARAIASLPPEKAVVLWRSIFACFGLLGGLAIGYAMVRTRPRTPGWFVPFAPACVLLTQATPLSLAWGQSSLLTLLGLALMSFAMLDRNRAVMAGALVVLAFKPHFAIVLGFGLLSRRLWWPSIAAAVAVTLLLAAPQFLAFGIKPFLVNFAGSMARYASDPPNRVENLTGLTQFAHALGLQVYAQITLPLAAITVWIGLRRLATQETFEARAAAAILVTATSCFFLPLHAYEAVCFAPAALLAWHFGSWRAAIMLVASLLLFRTGNVSDLFGPAPLLAGGRSVRELMLISSGLLIGFVGALAIAFAPRVVLEPRA